MIDLGVVPYRIDQVMHLEADISELHRVGWKSKMDLKSGLKKTIGWFREGV